ncbi:YybH family protein [Abyssalbus ytuae]|uniref:Nuclear transport factor 2 family protein n=1 Tax=Abyssalbus ytuae TaxID=2926907 RepID=A0A9E6ZML1_9FLAO|nr:nuclear transport factor 2 family protein [Abyssalbus ytuae]UOB18629.1 nuclear transport factor 2 family protein [Abyssalbus ytuae]
MKIIFYTLILLAFQNSLISCKGKQGNTTEDNFTQNKESFMATMQKHLDAVSNRDLIALKSTMAPNGKMQLILPKTEIIQGVEEFMEYHRVWFKDSLWTFETNILNTEIGHKFGMVITEIIYREPERNGQPYFNRMIVSYDLEKINGKWYIIKDHASSIEKSTEME